MIKKLLLPYADIKTIKNLLRELMRRYDIPVSEVNEIFKNQKYLTNIKRCKNEK